MKYSCYLDDARWHMRLTIMLSTVTLSAMTGAITINKRLIQFESWIDFQLMGKFFIFIIIVSSGISPGIFNYNDIINE